MAAMLAAHQPTYSGGDVTCVVVNPPPGILIVDSSEAQLGDTTAPDALQGKWVMRALLEDGAGNSAPQLLVASRLDPLGVRLERYPFHKDLVAQCQQGGAG